MLWCNINFNSFVFLKIVWCEETHTGYTCGFSPMCVKLWHCVHFWVFCPLWIIICHISSLTAWLFTLCTFVQFFPMWKSMCIFRVPASLNDLLHCTHLSFVQHLPAVNAQVSIISTNWFVAFLHSEICETKNITTTNTILRWINTEDAELLIGFIL